MKNGRNELIKKGRNEVIKKRINDIIKTGRNEGRRISNALQYCSMKKGPER